MKKEIAEEISQLFIEQLAAGVVPWKQPWHAHGLQPHNYFSRRPYRGINSLILDVMAGAKGYTSPAWTTYKAAAERGAQVRKGEKATRVVFWKPIKVKDKATGEDKDTVVARMYNVFNTDQIDGIDWIMPEMPEPPEVRDGVKLVVDQYPNPPAIEHRVSERAYYVPGVDKITIPLIEQFDTEHGYAETLFHELVHSTGHKSRLSRFEDGLSCRSSYAKEELVAEIGATMLMRHVGIAVDMPQMASYVASWLKALQDDHSLIVKAAQGAQKAVDHIVGSVSDD